MAGAIAEISLNGEAVKLQYNWLALDKAFSAIGDKKLEALFFEILNDGTKNEVHMAKGLYCLYVASLVIENGMELPKTESFTLDEFLAALPSSPAAIVSAWTSVMFPNG